MPQYTYLAAELATGRIISELPLFNVRYDLRVNDSAVMTATCPVDAILGITDNTVSVRTGIYVVRGDNLVYGGGMWGRQYDAANRTFTFDLADTLDYLDNHLFITNNLTYHQVDQIAIAKSLIQYANRKQGVNISATYFGTAASGVLRDRSYLGADKAPVGQRLRELSALIDGFDFRFENFWQSGVGGPIGRGVQFGYPTLGRSFPASQLVFDTQTDAINYTWAEDGKSMASTVYAAGALPQNAPTTATPPEYVAEDPTAPGAGYPRMEATLSYTDIIDRATLANHARGKLMYTQRPPQLYTLTISSEAVGAPQLGEYLPGDHCLIRIPRGDGLWRFGAEVQGIITAVSVAVDMENNDAITVGVVPYSTIQGEAR